MPFTPYHVGPGTFAGLVLNRWIDLPVFFLANLAVDLEVPVCAVLNTGFMPVRYGHTMVIASSVGIALGAAAYPMRGLFRRAMTLLRLPYRTSFIKMVLSGLLGAMLHVFVDGLYRSDVSLFWPAHVRNPFCTCDKNNVEEGCLFLLLLSLVLYVLIHVIRAGRKSE